MIEFGRDILNSSDESSQREWLLTNGTGSYAAGTVSGILTRRYHGLLVAALQPPLGRTVLVSKIDETARYDDHSFELYSNQWTRDRSSIAPQGFVNLNSFALEGTSPVWIYSIADALLEKRIWMHYGQNTTYVRYTLLRGTLSVDLSLKILVNFRDFHINTHAEAWQMEITPFDNGLEITALPDAARFALYLVGQGRITPQHTWYHDYFLSQELYRGLDAIGDQLLAGIAETRLQTGQSFTLVCSTEARPDLDVESNYRQHKERERALLVRCNIKDAPDWINQLVLAADQFVVSRTGADGAEGRSIIAGYHWFGDWGRDTMIALPGLALTTGRYEDAASILRNFAKYVDQGMLPNRFPDYGETPEYNTVDATLWYFEAIRQYFLATRDVELIREFFPILRDIIDRHIKGTRYNIQVDPADSLLYAGESSAQLTWMDAKVGGWVVTPRTGKPIEVNALWYNALRATIAIAQHLDYECEDLEVLAGKVNASFSRFWNTDQGYCFDVLDAPTGNDADLRPNQLFAVSLFYSPLQLDQQKSIVDHCARSLVTPYGLRSLAPSEPAYVGRYGGDTLQRDGSYHQGTVWAWLIGAFVQAHLRAYGNPEMARTCLSALQHHLNSHCVGTIGEIFDGDAPFTPRGAVAQAWSVAEVLRSWQFIENYRGETVVN